MPKKPSSLCKDSLYFILPFNLYTLLFLHRHKYKDLFNRENVPTGIILDTYKTRDAEVNYSHHFHALLICFIYL